MKLQHCIALGRKTSNTLKTAKHKQKHNHQNSCEATLNAHKQEVEV
jgi:hypothetical protein